MGAWIGSRGVADGSSLNWFDQLARRFEDVSIMSRWWIVGGAVVTLVLLVVAIRARPRRWLFLLVPATLLTLVFTIGMAVNQKYVYFRTLGELAQIPPYDTAAASVLTDPKGSFPRGAVVDVTIPATTSGVGDRPAKVYLPPQYFDHPDEQFPVIYLYHGVPGMVVPGMPDNSGPETLFTAGAVQDPALVAAKAGRPVVLVAPVVSPMSQDTECVDGVQGRWSTYLATDVLRWVAANPRFQTGEANTGMSGYSAGGMCAQVTALRNPDQVSVVGNFSGTAGPTYVGSAQDLFPASTDRAAQLEEYDSFTILKTNPAARAMNIWLEVGTGDTPQLQASQQSFATFARGLGMDIVDRQVPGGSHNFDTWTASFDSWIPWAAELLHRAPGDPVPAPPPSPSPSPTR